MPVESEELMRRVTLTFTLDQKLLEVEGKHASSGRLYNGTFRSNVAASFFRAIADRLADGTETKTPIPLLVNDSYEVLPDQ